MNRGMSAAIEASFASKRSCLWVEHCSGAVSITVLARSLCWHQADSSAAFPVFSPSQRSALHRFSPWRLNRHGCFLHGCSQYMLSQAGALRQLWHSWCHSGALHSEVTIRRVM